MKLVLATSSMEMATQSISQVIQASSYITKAFQDIFHFLLQIITYSCQWKYTKASEENEIRLVITSLNLRNSPPLSVAITQDIETFKETVKLIMS